LVQHVVQGGRSPSNRQWAKESSVRVKRLQKAADKLSRDANRAALQESQARRQEELRQQQAQAQMSAAALDEQRKNAVTQADIQRKDATTASDIRRKTAKTDVDIRLKAAKQGQTMIHADQRLLMDQQSAAIPQQIPEYTGEGEMGL
jgi:hypothetical protein